MAKEIRLNAFEMNCVAHQSPGLWRHPRDRSRDYRRLDGWIELAKTLERGLFDGLFLADVLGVYDVFGGGPEAALRHATQIPVNDPLLLVPAMAAATKHLGFGVTVTLSYEPPFPFARRMSTLDHLTEGRIGWNVVTGYLDSARERHGPAQASAPMTIAMGSRKIIWRSSTSSGKEAGPTTRSSRDAEEGRVHPARPGAQGPPRRSALQARRAASLGTLAATHAGALPGRNLAGGARLRRAPRRMRVHVRPVEAGGRARGSRRSASSRGRPDAIRSAFSCSR